MNSRDFCYWLQGYFEILSARQGNEILRELQPDQVEMIKRHLSMVFTHEIDPSFGDAAKQQKLNDIHHGHGKVQFRC